MVYIVVHSSFPSHVAPAIGKRYLEILQRFPPDPSISETIIPSAVKRTDSGIKSFSVSEVKEGKFEEAWKRASDQLAMTNDIEGYEVSLEVYATTSEALATIGMKLSG